MSLFIVAILFFNVNMTVGVKFDTVEPLLSGHPRGTGKWSLNRGSSEISTMRGINVTLFEYTTGGGLLNIIQPVFGL